MAKKASVAIKNDMTNHFGSIFAGGTVKIYSGAQPANADAAPTGILLVTINIPNPAFQAAVSGSASKTGTWQGPVLAAGSPGWFRMADPSGTKRIDGTASSVGGSDLVLDFAALELGQIAAVDVFTLSDLVNG